MNDCHCAIVPRGENGNCPLGSHEDCPPDSHGECPPDSRGDCSPGSRQFANPEGLSPVVDVGPGTATGIKKPMPVTVPKHGPLTVPKYGSKRNAGFTVLELTAAIFVMTVGLAGVAQLCRFGLDRMRIMEEQAIAVQAMQNEMESLRSMPFSALTDGAHSFVSTAATLERLGPLVEARVTIAPVPGVSAPLKEVTASVVWRTGNARRAERSITTLIAEKAP